MRTSSQSAGGLANLLHGHSSSYPPSGFVYASFALAPAFSSDSSSSHFFFNGVRHILHRMHRSEFPG